MKIKRFLLVLTCIILCANKVLAKTEYVVVDGIKYVLNINKNTLGGYETPVNACVVANTEYPYSGEVVIRNTIEHEIYSLIDGDEGDYRDYVTAVFKVTEISLDAFRFNTEITSVKISANCTNIPAKVFEGCISLSSIVVDPDNEVFDSRNNCNALIISKGNEGDWLYAGCKNTTIPEDVNYIFSNSFSKCYDLTSINIPDGVKKIGFNAFYECTGLTDIDTKNVSTIGEKAFYGCSSLASLTIRNASTIGNRAFASCQKLTDVFCYTNIVPDGFVSAFDNSASNAILHVHDYLVEDFKKLGLPFKEIVAIEGGGQTKIVPIRADDRQRTSYNINGIKITMGNNIANSIVIRGGKKYYIK